MQWGEIVQRIYKTLEENGNENLVRQLIDEHGIGGTPGEMFTMVCFWLAKMRNSGNPAFKLIEADAEALFRIGYDINYFTEASLKAK